MAHIEPIAYTVGDSIVRIDDLIPIGATDHVDDPARSRRVYTFRVTRNGQTATYRCKVKLSEIIRLTDQEIAEYLVGPSVRRLRLFGFKGDAFP